MATLPCIECDKIIDVAGRGRIGQKVVCPYCGALLEVVATEPLELDLAQGGSDEEWDDDLDAFDIDDDLDDDLDDDDEDDIVFDDGHDDDFDDDETLMTMTSTTKTKTRNLMTLATMTTIAAGTDPILRRV